MLLDTPQLAAWHLERSRDLHTEAGKVHREALRTAGDLREVGTEWLTMRERYTAPEAPRPSETELDRMVTLDRQVIVLGDSLRAGRERWRQIEAEAQGHEAYAVWLGADVPDAATAATDPAAALLGQLASEHDALAATLHGRAQDTEADILALATDLAPLMAEWSALLSLSSMTDAQAARFATLGDSIAQLTRRQERERERWRQIEQDAQGHTVLAAYLRAYPIPH